MSLKNVIKNIVIGGSIACGVLILPQIAVNNLNSGDKIEMGGYTCKIKKGIWPFAYLEQVKFQYRLEDDIEFYGKGMLTISSQGMFKEFEYCFIIDKDGDFKPDRFYQENVLVDRKDAPELFRDKVDPPWKKATKELNIDKIHKEWLETYGKYLIK